MRTSTRQSSLAVIALALALAAPRAAHADGFQLDRYEPAAAGSWLFGVEHPWYSSTRYLAAGLTLDYGHNPLLGGSYNAGGGFTERVAIVAHQLVGHLDVAGAFLDRVQLSASLPLVLLERGATGYGLSPLEGVAVSDPRLGGMVRLWRHADRDPISIHLAAQLWIPVGAGAHDIGDPGVRGMPMVILAGRFAGHLRWAFNGGVLLRGVTQVGSGPGSSIGSELDLRAAIGWSDGARTWHVGPEAWLSTAVTGANAFRRDATSLELLLGAQWNIARLIQVGAGIGTGVVSTLGTPDVRAIVRVAYAPVRQQRPGDADGDGIPDALDGCPDQPGVPGLGRANGCPDQDADGIPDAEDSCPDSPAGALPDPARHGCPAKDSDHDGIPDAQDDCPNAPAGAHPDPREHGCPAKDGDADGIPDAEDVCPDSPPGAHPDPNRSGCPQPDRDHDGIPDAEDVCPNSPPGAHPDPKRSGCPEPDADADGIPDAQDGCPNLGGAPDPNPRKNGCPKIEAKEGSLTELRAVHFATNESTLLPESFVILDELADLLNHHKEVRSVEISGHADDTGTHEWNLKLSRRRAESVVDYLVKKGVARHRMHPVGYGDTRPLSPDRSDESRARNRRVEMRVPKAK